MEPNMKSLTEKQLVSKMIQIYCAKHHHPPNDICSECLQLLEYCHLKLDSCPLKQAKPSCGRCTIKCYAKDMQEKIKAVMRFSGPRILFYEPIATIHYFIKKFYK
ncbi:nitrous oxide-stimulated promoter family protein [Clostridium sp. 'deep sea']|nr:nitrous oxide-stimulated promoter family protein [Clostridium sp. 'deep sea']